MTAAWTQVEAELGFDEYIDELHEPTTILGMTYSASKLLLDSDPVAYRQGFLDWMDSDYHELGE